MAGYQTHVCILYIYARLSNPRLSELGYLTDLTVPTYINVTVCYLTHVYVKLSNPRLSMLGYLTQVSVRLSSPRLYAPRYLTHVYLCQVI